MDLFHSSLIRYLSKHFQSPEIDRIQKFSNGQSNPTYLIHLSHRRSSGDEKLVLRKQPDGLLLKGAHNVVREGKLMKYLREVNPFIPLPTIHFIEEDRGYIGTQFFIMDFVEGTIYRSACLDTIDQANSKSMIYCGMAQVLANIHNTSISSLEGIFGKVKVKSVEEANRRQVHIWKQQYSKSCVSINMEPLPEMQELGSWLEKTLPCSSTTAFLTLVHGDFRLDNMIFNQNSEVIAVLDWELSSIGANLADLAYCCLGYYLPSIGFLKDFSVLSKDGSIVPGIPSLSEFIQTYQSFREGENSVKNDLMKSKEWCFYLCLGLFRIASIAAGVYSRALQGNASQSKQALQFKDAVVLLSRTALHLITEFDTKEKILYKKESRVGYHPSARCLQYMKRLKSFMDECVIPAEASLTIRNENSKGTWPDRGDKWSINPIIEDLIAEAKMRGLWNLWMTSTMESKLKKRFPSWPWHRILPHKHGFGHLDYAYLAIESGRSLYGAECINCMAPDTGNMEILALFATKQQQEEWLLPLLLGEMKSCFGMTEPSVASSDPTQLQSTAILNGNKFVVNGTKWWTTGACDPRCKICLFIARTEISNGNKRHQNHSLLLVPMDNVGVSIKRPLSVFGYEDAPHGHAEVDFVNVVVPEKSALIGNLGGGFALAQVRLGPGRLHHCCRLVGHCERALAESIRRGSTRKAFGKTILDLGGNMETLGKCRVSLRTATLAVYDAASHLDFRDSHSSKDHKLSEEAINALAICKISVPLATQQCLDFAIQIHGGGGLSADHPLAAMWAAARTLRIVDGVDEVHLRSISRSERKLHSKNAELESKSHPGVGRPRL
jgi:acyl-CoA dehydrogenase